MALFDKSKAVPVDEVMQLRQQGLTDDLIMEELAAKGYSQPQINQALEQFPDQADNEEELYASEEPPKPSSKRMPALERLNDYSSEPAASGEMGNIYERIEEIAESMIDEKWDDLIAEVKKIVEWKEKMEEKQGKMISELEMLKENFKELHQGVLGKLEDYDAQMREVGTELKAVGKVFKDVIPTFVDNVKELKDITKKVR